MPARREMKAFFRVDRPNQPLCRRFVDIGRELPFDRESESARQRQFASKPYCVCTPVVTAWPSSVRTVVEHPDKAARIMVTLSVRKRIVLIIYFGLSLIRKLLAECVSRCTIVSQKVQAEKRSASARRLIFPRSVVGRVSSRKIRLGTCQPLRPARQNSSNTASWVSSAPTTHATTSW